MFATLHSRPLTLTAALLLVLVAAVFSENYALSIPGCSISMAYPLTMSAMVLYGPSAAAVVAASTAANYSDIRRRIPMSVVAFNLGQLVLSTLSSGWVFLALGGRPLLAPGDGPHLLSASDFPRILVPLMSAAVVCAITNMLLTSLGSAVKSGSRTTEVLSVLIRLLPTQVALAFVGYLLAQVMAISLVALPLFVFPLVVARQAFERYTGLREAYSSTVASLVGAVEAKDPYTRGHSERVAKYAVELGRQVGLDAVNLERLERAALLHDLGKIGLAHTLIAKPGRLSETEFEAMRNHPAAGARMIQRIPLLRDLARAVGEHHERFAGEGYPGGLHGGQIAYLARIMAVADAYDAMTSDRAYRGAMSHAEALDQLIDGSGTQFDPALVDAFIDARIANGAPSDRADLVWDQHELTPEVAS